MLHTLEPKVFGVGVFGDFRPILATQETGLKNCRLKKPEFFKTVNSQYFLTKISGISSRARRIN